MTEPAPKPEFPARLDGGENGRALAFAEGVLHLACERAHPPGQPLAVALALADGELRVQGKSAGSKRRDDGSFDVRLRLHSIRRDERERLERAFAS